MESYCMKCKRMRKMVQEKEVKSNGRKRLIGKCQHCKTNMSKFI